VKKRPYSVPVLMFHSVGASHLDWPYRFLSEPVALFERKIDYLLRRGYEFIFHDDLYHYMKGEQSLSQKAVMLTFDDGFLDNWVIAFPILKRRGVKFTIYVSQEFVDISETPRPTLEDLWDGRANEDDLQILGYLSWAEMRRMEASGLVDIQSHTSTHTWHFVSGDIIDFYHPGNASQYPWMQWNRFPSKKPRWMLHPPEQELWGLPVYENKRAMVARRYLEDPALNRMIRDFVLDNGAETFFSRTDWRKVLTQLVRRHLEKEKHHARFETDSEQEARLRYELWDNRRAIEQALKKEVRYLCWPGGAYNDRLIRLAQDCGFRASTVKRGRNAPGDDARFIHRISSGNPLGAHRFPWKNFLFTLKFYLDRFHGNAWAVALDRIYRYFSKR